MLEVTALDYGYPGRSIGRDALFNLSVGEVLCVLGPNGGGKTTLFRTVLGLLAPRAGTVMIGGRPLAAWTRNELARMVGYVPQAHSGYFDYTVREMVLMGRTSHIGLFASPSRVNRDAASRAIETLGITHLADQAYTRISGGERQLALIARALAQGSRLLVMDEPTASLDFGNQVRVLNQIAALADSGIGILFSTHDPDQAFMCADRVMLLRPGGILRLGRPDQIITRDNLRELYGIDVEIVKLSNRRRICSPALVVRKERAVHSAQATYRGPSD